MNISPAFSLTVSERHVPALEERRISIALSIAAPAFFAEYARNQAQWPGPLTFGQYKSSGHNDSSAGSEYNAEAIFDRPESGERITEESARIANLQSNPLQRVGHSPTSSTDFLITCDMHRI
ncbi:hypothetical protein WIW49_12615 [Xanthomonas euroxanthea]